MVIRYSEAISMRLKPVLTKMSNQKLKIYEIKLQKAKKYWEEKKNYSCKAINELNRNKLIQRY